MTAVSLVMCFLVPMFERMVDIIALIGRLANVADKRLDRLEGGSERT